MDLLPQCTVRTPRTRYTPSQPPATTFTRAVLTARKSRTAAAAIPVAGSIFHPTTVFGDRVAFVAAATPEFLPELLDPPPLTLSA